MVPRTGAAKRSRPIRPKKKRGTNAAHSPRPREAEALRCATSPADLSAASMDAFVNTHTVGFRAGRGL
jgi:hypothetical protein